MAVHVSTETLNNGASLAILVSRGTETLHRRVFHGGNAAERVLTAVNAARVAQLAITVA